MAIPHEATVALDAATEAAPSPLQAILSNQQSHDMDLCSLEGRLNSLVGKLTGEPQGQPEDPNMKSVPAGLLQEIDSAGTVCAATVNRIRQAVARLEDLI